MPAPAGDEEGWINLFSRFSLMYAIEIEVQFLRGGRYGQTESQSLGAIQFNRKSTDQRYRSTGNMEKLKIIQQHPDFSNRFKKGSLHQHLSCHIARVPI